MFATIYHGYIGFAMTLFTIVGALSVCVIACIILANTLQELLIKFKDNWDEYRFFIYNQANFELWLDSNGYKKEWLEENNKARWVKDDKK